MWKAGACGETSPSCSERFPRCWAHAVRTERRRRAAHRLFGLRELSRASGARPRVSIVVVSYRRHAEIRACLRDLDAQSTTVPFEVVLVLQAYPPGVPEALAAEFSSTLPVSTYHTDRGLGVHAARNAAVA